MPGASTRRSVSMGEAFALVELIFVIVIIGILAGVAMTKFNATREDAQISMLSGRISSAVSEISAYAVSHASLEGEVVRFSNVVAEMVGDGSASIRSDENRTEISIRGGEVRECAKLVLSSGALEENLTLYFDDTQGDPVCDGLKKRFADVNSTMILRGRIAKF